MGDSVQRRVRDSNFQSSMRMRAAWLCAFLALVLPASAAHGYDVNDKLSIGVTGSGAAQCQEIDAGGPDQCREALSLQSEFSFNDDGDNSAFVKFGLGAGNGLAPVSPFALTPWAADLEADVKNINGRSRDHLLTAWYRRRFHLPGDTTLAVTGGIIDSTDYLDDNAFANDEYNQFMNEAFVNAPTGFLPSYDNGAAVELDRGPWSLCAVVMQVHENDDGRGYTFYGGQAAYTRKSQRGEGTYRIIIAGADDKFLDPSSLHEEGLAQITLSADQQINDYIGIFLRLGWQDDDAAVTHDAFYSGGVNISGGLWGRPDNTIGIGFAHLEGGNTGISSTHVGEVYYNFAVNDHLSITGDIQLMKDNMSGGDAKGAIFSLRATKEY